MTGLRDIDQGLVYMTTTRGGVFIFYNINECVTCINSCSQRQPMAVGLLCDVGYKVYQSQF